MVWYGMGVVVVLYGVRSTSSVSNSSMSSAPLNPFRQALGMLHDEEMEASMFLKSHCCL